MIGTLQKGETAAEICVLDFEKSKPKTTQFFCRFNRTPKSQNNSDHTAINNLSYDEQRAISTVAISQHRRKNECDHCGGFLAGTNSRFTGGVRNGGT